MKRLSVLALAALVFVFFAAGCNVKDNTNSDATTSTDDQTTAVTSAETGLTPLPTMLELGSEGCKPCEQMKPVMAGLEQDYNGIIRVTFHDVRKNPDIANEYGIKLIPTQVFLDADGNEFYRHEGFFPREDIEKVFRDMGVEL
ncbi:thioredoxin [bacterium]|nr:thioredoxin [bacterium]